jgi:predicted transcriptional regulator
MLEAAMGGATKTKIMYKGYLSYNQLKEYLEVLLANGLIEYKQGEEKFYTTSKGMKFLGISTQLDLLVSPLSMAKERK